MEKLFAEKPGCLALLVHKGKIERSISITRQDSRDPEDLLITFCERTDEDLVL